MKKVVILGAGVTGLTLARMLRGYYDVTILEKDSQIGGIAKTKQVENVTYHLTGGHCFNSKFDEIMSFVFHILPNEEWHKVARNSQISLKQFEIPYPIEYSVKKIYQYDKELAISITRDFLAKQENSECSTLEDWFISKFGKTLAELYFLPYNTKIWNRNLSEMSYEWVEDKLPIPDKESFFESLISEKKDAMPHSTFYYPDTNDQMTMINRLAQGTDIRCEVNVDKIEKVDNRWIVNEEYDADILISTLPVNRLPGIVRDTPFEVLDAASKLKYNGVTNMLWETHESDKTWTYYPSGETIFHRYIHIGNFFSPRKPYTIVEAIGNRSYDEMLEYGKKDSFLLRPVDYHTSEYAYVVYDEFRSESLRVIFDYLRRINLYSIGRFGQWDYYNMDVCMKQSLELATKLIEKAG